MLQYFYSLEYIHAAAIVIIAWGICFGVGIGLGKIVVMIVQTPSPVDRALRRNRRGIFR